MAGVNRIKGRGRGNSGVRGGFLFFAPTNLPFPLPLFNAGHADKGLSDSNIRSMQSARLLCGLRNTGFMVLKMSKKVYEEIAFVDLVCKIRILVEGISQDQL